MGSSEEEEEEGTMKCVTCKEEYAPSDACTCRECYEEASETEEELKREIEELKSKVNFLRFFWGSHLSPPPFSDIVLVASDDLSSPSPVTVPAHRAVLACRSPVFRAMLENKMEESLSGTIKIGDVSYDALRAFVNYLYTAEASLDENMACNLLDLLLDGTICAGDQPFLKSALFEMGLLHRAVRKNSRHLVELLLRYTPQDVSKDVLVNGGC